MKLSDWNEEVKIKAWEISLLWVLLWVTMFMSGLAVWWGFYA